MKKIFIYTAIPILMFGVNHLFWAYVTGQFDNSLWSWDVRFWSTFFAMLAIGGGAGLAHIINEQQPHEN